MRLFVYLFICGWFVDLGWSDNPDIQSHQEISNSAYGLVGHFCLDWISLNLLMKKSVWNLVGTNLSRYKKVGRNKSRQKIHQFRINFSREAFIIGKCSLEDAKYLYFNQIYSQSPANWGTPHIWHISESHEINIPLFNCYLHWHCIDYCAHQLSDERYTSLYKQWPHQRLLYPFNAGFVYRNKHIPAIWDYLM